MARQGEYQDDTSNTGLHYNLNRYYDPRLGRYLTPDPIKLIGGLNCYQYVDSDPINWIDPEGLKGQPGSERSLMGERNPEPNVQNPNAGDPKIPSYDTPFNPLTPTQRKALEAKIANRSATREDMAHLDWDRRFSNRRNRGVNRFWADEKQRLKRGEPGTRNWTNEQRDAILSGKRPKFDGKTIEGHHIYNALDYPQLADSSLNIYPATKYEHLYRWHGGNFRNDTMGKPNNPNILEEF